MRVVRLPRLSRRVVIAATLPAAAALVATAFVSPPIADAARTRPTVTATVTQTVTAPPVTSTVTVTEPGSTVTVTEPGTTVTSTITEPAVTVTAAPVTSTVTAPPQTVTVTATPSPTTTTTPPPPVPTAQPAIGRWGKDLIRADVPWRAAGFNLPNIMGCNTADTSAATDARLNQFFAGLPAHSLTRVWPYANSSWQTIMPRVVKAAEANGQYLMVVLADKNASGTQCGSNLGTTYPADGGAVKTHATNVVTAYRNSPAVAMWEVLNEGEYAASTKPFYGAVVAEIRRLDPYAVIGYGTKTCYYAVGTATWNECKDTMGQPDNDFIDLHEYDAGTGVSHWTDEHQRIASDTGKPWLVGEFGFCCGGTPTTPTGWTPFTSFDASNGADYVKAEWSSYLNAGASAVLYWSAVLQTSNTVFDQLSPSKAAWPGIGTHTNQWQGS